MIKASDFLMNLLLDVYAFRPESSDYFLIRYTTSSPDFGIYSSSISLDSLKYNVLIYKVK